MAVPKYQTILATLDGSDVSAQVLPHARFLASSLGSQLILFRVVPEISDDLEVASLGAGFVDLGEIQHSAAGRDNQQGRLLDEAEQSLNQIAHSLEAQGIRVRVVVEIGQAAESIVGYMQREAVDLIVMCTHGRTGLPRLVYGSVAEKVMHTATCPVLLVRADIGRRP